MSESVFVDTGYILALVNENDQHHAEALVLSKRFDGQPVVVTDAVLLEIGNALSRMDRNAAVQIIQDLRDSPGATVVNLTPELFESAFDLYRHHIDKQWGLVDCVSFIVMRRMGLTTALALPAMESNAQAGSPRHKIGCRHFPSPWRPGAARYHEG
jgi:predicted nucleic acid-binding protein